MTANPTDALEAPVSIFRSEVMQRPTTIWAPPGSVGYSQDDFHEPDLYRDDCSGFVSMCWKIPLDAPGSWGGLNTVTLVTAGWMYEIDVNDLKPGDAVGLCGPGTAGDAGHVQLFAGWKNMDPNDSHYYCWEQYGSGPGPHYGYYDLAANKYKAYRFKDITDDTPAPPPAHVDAPPYPLWSGHVYGLITGPDWCHGGWHAEERDGVRRIQQRLIAAGCVPGVTDPNDGWADGLFEQPTADAVCRFQQANGLEIDGLVGPQTWARLMS